MSSQPASAEDLIEEEGQLKRCRWGLLLLGAGLLLQLGVFFLSVLSLEEAPSKDPARIAELQARRILDSYELGLLTYCLTFLPGSILLIRNARSERWRRSAYFLLATLILDMALMGTVVSLLFSLGKVTTLPLLPYVLVEVNSLLVWPLLWFMAVVVAEFAMASRAEMLVHQTERLSYALLVGGCASVAYVGWTLPTYPLVFDPANADGMTAFFGLVSAVVSFFCLFWTMRLLATAATLARVLLQRSEQARHRDEIPASQDKET